MDKELIEVLEEIRDGINGIETTNNIEIERLLRNISNSLTGIDVSLEQLKVELFHGCLKPIKVEVINKNG